MKIRPLFAWYDLWVGAYWDAKARRLYVLPVPIFGVVIEFGRGDMKDALVEFLRFLWTRSSERACCLAIVLVPWLSAKDCRQLGEYFKASADNKATTTDAGE